MMTTTATQTGRQGTRLDLAELAHLLRRAGFGATPEELQGYARMGYEATVEQLLHPGPIPTDEALLVDRYFPASTAAHEWAMAWPHWAWPLVTTKDPLREKIALFWHGLFATGFKLGIHGVSQIRQFDMFREHGLDRFGDILLRLAQDPAMILWLDNDSNTRERPNENFGRELLELFSMGEGHYTEDDVKAAARAFTGWTVRPSPSPFLMGPFAMEFRYDAEHHDDGEKTFLGELGAWNGQDVIRIIARQPATADFVCRRLYQFFLDEEVDELALAELTAVFRTTHGDIREVLRTLFLSESFRSPEGRYRLVKSPIELVFGLTRLTLDWRMPDHRLMELVDAACVMGQTPLNPPNVGGWPSGIDWLNGSCMLERINFASRMIGDESAPGVQRILARVEAREDRSGEVLLAACLEALGQIDVDPASRTALVEVAREVTETPANDRGGVIRLLKLIVATPSFQYC